MRVFVDVFFLGVLCENRGGLVHKLLLFNILGSI